MSISSIFFIISGSVIGSFLNVVIYRLPLQKRGGNLNLITPPSHCPTCKSNIPFWYNVPIMGWIMLAGRCVNCKAPVSKQYIFVEILTAFLFFIIIHNDGVNPASLLKLFIISILIPLAFIDSKTMRLPDVLTLPLLFTGLIASIMGWNSLSFEEVCIAAVSIFLILSAVSWGVYKLYGKQALGFGDVKLYTALAAYLGLNIIWSVMLYSSLLAIILNLVFFRKKIGQKFAYGPYIISVAIIYILFHPVE